MFTSIDAAVSKNALGLMQLREGRPLDAGKSFALSGLAPFTTAAKGIKVRRAYLRGTDDPVLVISERHDLPRVIGVVRMRPVVLLESSLKAL